MIQTDVLVSDIEPVGPFVRVVLRSPGTQSAPIFEPAQAAAAAWAPGRFVLAALEGYLRTPLFPALLRPAGAAGNPGEIELLVAPEHPAARLARRTTVNLLGPLGHGFEVPAASRRLLLVANASRLPLLLGLALQELAHERSVALLVESPSVSLMYPIHLLPAVLEVRLVTPDGSAGERGSALDLFPDLTRWADCICIADDPARYPLYSGIVREVRIGPARGLAQVLWLPPLACGVGACQGCAVQTAHGTRLACSDGPVFDLLELQ